MSHQMQPGGLLMPGAPRPKHHPLAGLFPMLTEDRRESFRASLADQQNHPIVLHRGMILDGRNRERELVELGKPVAYVVFAGDNRQAFDFVMAENLERRHLTESQRAMIAAKAATLRLGDNQHTQLAPIGGPSLFSAPDEVETAPAAVISQTEAADMLNVGRRSVQRAAVVLDQGTPDLQAAVQEDRIAVSVAEKIARLPETEQPAALEKALPNGNRAIMSSRQEPDDSLDFFPTPPWATRALIERVLRNPACLNVWTIEDASVWEPACGEGHIAEVLREYFGTVLSTDIFDYGYGDRTVDFLSDLEVSDTKSDFIITNPPFGDKGEAFVLQALKLAREGVAMFVRLQWLETIGRYENIFRDHPPTLIAFFPERVNLCKGRWDPEGGTATAYIWLVWLKDEKPCPPFWIPPGCREALTRPDDAKRFTQHPVAKQQSLDIDAASPGEAGSEEAA
jgi:hypothetical protein